MPDYESDQTRRDPTNQIGGNVFALDQIPRQSRRARTYPPNPTDQDDILPAVSDTEVMTDFTRHELDAKLSATEARMDARVASIEGKIDAFLAAQAERDKAAEYRVQRIESDTASIKSDVKEISTQVQGIRITMAKYLGAAIVIGAIASAAVGTLIRLMLTTPLT